MGKKKEIKKIMADDKKSLPDIKKEIDELTQRAKSPQPASIEEREKQREETQAQTLSLSAQMQSMLSRAEYGTISGQIGLGQAGLMASAEKLAQVSASIPGASMAGSPLAQMMKGYRERSRQGGSGGMTEGSGGGVGRYSGGGGSVGRYSGGGGYRDSSGGGGGGGSAGGESYGSLKDQRERFRKEVEGNPELRRKVVAIAANENNDPRAQQAVIETMMNRAAMRGKTLASEAKWVTEHGYYDDRHGGHSRGDRAAANPTTRAGLDGRLNAALGGSNISKWGTGNASGNFVEGRIQKGMYSRTAQFGGESFVTEGGADYKRWRQGVGRDKPINIGPSTGEGGGGRAPNISAGAVTAVGGGAPKAFIMHHTGGRGSVAGVQSTLRQRHLGVQYVMDREGNITRTGGPGVSHMLRGSGAGAGLSNQNVVGMEVIAKNDRDVTPAQVKAAREFIGKNYPNTPVFGHGEVNPGHKEASEGMTIVNSIRQERKSSPGREARERGRQEESTIRSGLDKREQELSGKKGTMLFVHGMEDRYGNVSKADVETSADKFAKAHGYSGIKAISSNDPKAVQEALNDKDITGVYGFSRGGNRLRTILQDPNTSADVKKRIQEAYLVGSPETKGDIPGIKTTDVPYIKDVDHMHMVQHMAEQAGKEAPRERKQWPGEKEYKGPQKGLDAKQVIPQQDAQRVSSERAFGGPETSTVKTQWDTGHGIASGSAFSIGDGYFITHAHGINQSQIGLGMGETQVHAQVIRKNDTLDYSLLKTSEADTTKLKGAGLTNLPISKEAPEKGDILTAHGYPRGGAYKNIPGTYAGSSEGGQLGGVGGGRNIGSLYNITPQERRNLEQRTVGASGGPVTDASGRVIGIQTGVSGPGTGTQLESMPMASILKDIPKGTIPQHIIDNAMAKERQGQQAAPEHKQWPGEKPSAPAEARKNLPLAPEEKTQKPAPSEPEKPRGQPSPKAADGTPSPHAEKAEEQARGGRMHIPGKDLRGVDPELRGRLEAAYRAAPASAKAGFMVLSGRRSTELQAKLYQRYKSGKGGIAAAPGHSKHESGHAIDIRDPSGWFHKHGKEFGIHAPMGRKDWPHFQMDPSYRGPHHQVAPSSYQDKRPQEIKKGALREKAAQTPGHPPAKGEQPHKAPPRQQPQHHHPKEARGGEHWASTHHASPTASAHSQVLSSYKKRDERLNHRLGDTP